MEWNINCLPILQHTWKLYLFTISLIEILEPYIYYTWNPLQVLNKVQVLSQKQLLYRSWNPIRTLCNLTQLSVLLHLMPGKQGSFIILQYIYRVTCSGNLANVCEHLYSMQCLYCSPAAKSPLHHCEDSICIPDCDYISFV